MGIILSFILIIAKITSERTDNKYQDQEKSIEISLLYQINILLLFPVEDTTLPYLIRVKINPNTLNQQNSRKFPLI